MFLLFEQKFQLPVSCTSFLLVHFNILMLGTTQLHAGGSELHYFVTTVEIGGT
jgi:hypothetical protein